MPEPFGFKENVPRGTKMQICIFPRPDSGYTIIKHIMFKESVKVSLLQKLFYGAMHRRTFVHPKIGNKVWQYAFEALGCHQCRCMGNCMEATKTAQKNDFNDKTDEEVDAGFDHILNHAPRAKNGLKQLRWQTKELKNKDGPLVG